MSGASLGFIVAIDHYWNAANELALVGATHVLSSCLLPWGSKDTSHLAMRHYGEGRQAQFAPRHRKMSQPPTVFRQALNW